MNTYRYFTWTRQGDVGCLRLRNTHLDETEIQQFGEDVLRLCQEEHINHHPLSLGSETPRCLFSVFLTKLIQIRNAMHKRGGQLVLCEVNPVTYSTFEACRLQNEFVFVADFDAARDYFVRQNGQVSSN